MRLFIALSPSEEAKAALERDLNALRKCCRKGSFSRAENLHITLAFLGEVPEERLDDLRAAMDGCGAGPFGVTVGDLGRFRGREGDTLVFRVDGGDPLRALQKKLSENLISKGFALEDRAFRPHLTLARRASLRAGETIPTVSARLEPVSFTAERMVLSLSHRPEGVLTYTPLFTETL